MKISLIVMLLSLFFAANSCGTNNTARDRNNTPQPKQAPAPEGYIPKPPEKRAENLEGCIDSTKINPDAVCYDLYDPVCGCDSITYSNDCQARNMGLKEWTKGTCN